MKWYGLFVCFLVMEWYDLFVYFGDEALGSHIMYKYFLPVCKLMVSFAMQKRVSLIRSHLFIFCFYFCCLGRLLMFIKTQLLSQMK